MDQEGLSGTSSSVAMDGLNRRDLVRELKEQIDEQMVGAIKSGEIPIIHSDLKAGPYGWAVACPNCKNRDSEDGLIWNHLVGHILYCLRCKTFSSTYGLVGPDGTYHEVSLRKCE